MKKLRLLLVMMFVFAGIGVQAQTNTGTKPFVNSTHTYSVTKGMTNSDLAWTVPTGTVGGSAVTPNEGTHYNVVSGAGTKDIQIKWLLAGTYTLRLSETRNLASGHVGCPTNREITVTVVDNTFDVIAEEVLDYEGDGTYVYAEEDCATLANNPVPDLSNLGDNSDDVFGTTKRKFRVRMTGGDASKSWSFNYTLTDIETTYKLKDVTIDGGTFAGGLVNVPANTSEVIISITYSTNKNTDTSVTNGQDPDVTLELAISDAKDELGTPDSDLEDTSNKATYTIYAVPATSGITTN